jgi:hypothetical protein
LGYTKQTTTTPLEEYEEEQMIVGVSTSPQHVDEGENEEDSVKTCLDGTKRVDEGGNEEGRVEKVETGLDGIKQVDEGGNEEDIIETNIDDTWGNDGYTGTNGRL